MYPIENYSDIWNKIDKVDCEKFSYLLETPPPLKLVEITNALGIDVFRSPLPPSVSGLIRKSNTSESGYEIILNKYDIKVRQRFTLAHEIGHYLLHRRDIGDGIQDSALYRSKLSSFKETEANKFAASLLLPDKLLTQFIYNNSNLTTQQLVSKVAEEFNVSTSAVEIRLRLDG